MVAEMSYIRLLDDRPQMLYLSFRLLQPVTSLVLLLVSLSRCKLKQNDKSLHMHATQCWERGVKPNP